MSERQAGSAGMPSFDAAARAEEIRRASQREEPEARRGRGRGRSFGGDLSGGQLFILGLLGTLAIITLAMTVVGLPLTAIGGKAVLLVPLVLLVLCMRGGAAG